MKAIIVALCVLATLATVCQAKIAVTLYAEATCPFCAQFVTKEVAPLFENGISDLMLFQYVAWGNAVNTTQSSPSHLELPKAEGEVPDVGRVQCQHGVLECQLNRVINCATEMYPAQDKWFPFVACLEGAPSTGRVAFCAGKHKLDTQRMQRCATGAQGDELEIAAELQTDALEPPHKYVPWVVVNGVPLGSNYGSLESILCAGSPAPRPKACADVPDAVLKATLRTPVSRR